MKTKLLAFLLLCLCSYLHAQENLKFDRKIRAYDRYWQFDFRGGANFDLTHSSSNPNAGLLSTRPNVVPTFAVRITQLFSKRVGWYTNVQVNLYKEKHYGNSRTDQFFQDLFDEIFPGLSSIHPSIDAGFVYRYEKNRFRLHPSIGMGFNLHLCEKESSRIRKNTEGVESETYFKQRPGYLSVAFGLSASYFISKRSFLTLNTSWSQPLQKSYSRLIKYENGVEKEKLYYKTRTAGRNLNISLGYGFAFGKR